MTCKQTFQDEFPIGDVIPRFYPPSRVYEYLSRMQLLSLISKPLPPRVHRIQLRRPNGTQQEYRPAGEMVNAQT